MEEKFIRMTIEWNFVLEKMRNAMIAILKAQGIV